jgi:hypothetical protein
MKQLIGRSCCLAVCINGRDLFYTAKEVLDVSDTHITFIDRYNKQYTINLNNVVEIQDPK